MEEVDRTDEIEWLQALPLLQDQIATIIRTLCQVDADGNPTASLDDYVEAVEKLPPVLSAMEKVPSPRVKELRQAKRAYEEGLDTFIKAAQRGAKVRVGELSTERSRAQLADLVFNVGVGAELIQQAIKTANEFSRK
jgi:hypothetical protein